MARAFIQMRSEQMEPRSFFQTSGGAIDIWLDCDVAVLQRQVDLSGISILRRCKIETFNRVSYSPVTRRS